MNPQSFLAALSRSMILRVGVLLLAGGVTVRAQALSQQDASTVDDLIANGQYGAANAFVKARLDRLSLLGEGNGVSPFYEGAAILAYAGKLYVEIGRLNEADEALKTAQASARIWDYWEAAITREQAALYFARGDYATATTAAARAYLLSRERRYWKVRAAYCQSVGALAQLRMGNVDRAKQLVLEAVKAVPSGSDRSLFFAPRILYAACLVEGYRGNHSVAEGYCQRGIKMSEKSRAESRDSSLGYLALAESSLQRGDLVSGRASGRKALELTYKLFGRKHQDAVDALQVLALVDLKEGKASEARMNARSALQIANELFGEGSLGVVRPRQTLNQVLKTSE